MINVIFFIVTAMILSACGSLHVKVDVIDPGYLEQKIEQPALHTTLNIVLSQTHEFVSQTLNRQSREHEKYYHDLATQYRNEAKAAAAPKQRNTLVALADSLENAVGDAKARYTKASSEIIAINKRIQEALTRLPDQERATTLDRARPIRGGLAYLLRERDAWLRSLRDFIHDETGSNENILKELTGERLQIAKQSAKVFVVETDTNYKSLTGGLDLTDDPRAHAVAAAPPEVWAQKFNEAVAQGYLGNIDIAIKMNKPGDFTIKGLLFDPSTVASVASKTVTQALLVAAQISGVPVSTSSGTGDGAALASTSTSLNTAQVAMAERKSAQNASRAALLDIADTIVREKQNLADDSKRQAAIEAIQITFSKHQSRINPVPPTK